MPRTAGSRNKRFDEKKEALLLALTEFALNSDLRRPSLREFAQNVGVSEPTLRHYFEDRRGVVRAILTDIARRGRVIWDALASPAESVEAGLQAYFQISATGIAHGGFVRTHAFGLIEGLADPEIGQVYASLILEPSLQALMEKARLSGADHLSENELRTFALAAFSPLLVMSLHQDLLGAQTMEPVPVEGVMDTLRAWMTLSTKAPS
ncbi:MAG: TetR/AcrR family transcriptional regulator [Pseudomonadota bacterium]